MIILNEEVLGYTEKARSEIVWQTFNMYFFLKYQNQLKMDCNSTTA